MPASAAFPRHAFLTALVLSATPAVAQKVPSHALTVDPARVAVEGFMGFGAEWDPYAYDRLGVTDEDFALIARRIRWMRMPIVRVMMQTKWCYNGAGEFDWDSRAMQLLYRHLDLCQQAGITVLLTDWGCEPEWLRIPGVENVADPKYAQAIGGYMDHLLNTKGYSCIRYFILVNEPNFEVKDFDRWQQGLRNVAAEFARRGLDKQVALVGPDHSNADDWLFNAVDELKDVLGGYDVHRYANDADVRPGRLEEYFANQWRYVLAHDPAAAAKPRIVGEAGMNDFAVHPRGNDKIDTFEYGLFMADYAVQALRAGSHAVCAWMMCDNSHSGFFWGLWSNKEKGLKLRPWFYSWSLLARHVPRGSTIYALEQPSPDWRVFAARTDAPAGQTEGGNWTFCLVNRGDETVRVRVNVPGGGQVTLREFLYAKDAAPTDEDGFPIPHRSLNADLADGLDLECPATAVVLATTMDD